MICNRGTWLKETDNEIFKHVSRCFNSEIINIFRKLLYWKTERGLYVSMG